MVKHYLLAAFGWLLFTATAWAAQPVVMSETETPVVLSNRDVNRIVCTNGPIEDVFYSAEKGLIVKTTGNNAMIKYRVRTDTNPPEYVTTQTEIHLVCNGEFFTLLGQPKATSAVTVRLTGGVREQAKKNRELYAQKDWEQRIIHLTRAALTDQLPSTFEHTRLPADTAPIPLYEEVELQAKDEVRVKGTGLSLTRYMVRARQDVALHEADFLHVALGERIVGVTLDPLSLKKGQTGTLLIVQHVAAGE